MNTKRLSDAMEKALSDQMNTEDLQSRIYFSYGIWAADAGYDGVSNFLFRHAQEERDHAVKFMMYVLERGGKPTITELAGPGPEPKSMHDCFNNVYKREVENTQSIYQLVNLALEEKDWASWNFLQWFVKEQTEEEKLAADLISRLKIAGGDRAKDESLLLLDTELKNFSGEATLAREATGENPG